MRERKRPTQPPGPRLCANGCNRPTHDERSPTCEQCLCGDVPFPNPELLTLTQLNVYRMKYAELKGEQKPGPALRAWTAITGHTASLTTGHPAPGERRSPTYKSWQSMWERCTNPNHVGFSHYGGRGLAVCARWRDFRLFLADMGERPEGMTLDRIKNALGYEPGNCRWATALEQGGNKRSAGEILTELQRAAEGGGR